MRTGHYALPTLVSQTSLPNETTSPGSPRLSSRIPIWLLGLNIIKESHFLVMTMLVLQANETAERQLEETCYALSSFDTPYNKVASAITYSGIMFDLFTKAEPLEILTLEIGVRLSAVDDYSVQVYTTSGAYLSKINDPSQWELVADAEGIPTPDGNGIIIPQRVFTNVNVGARERLSVYIQMKGPWVENRAEALKKTGELAFEGGDFNSYAGIGTGSLFPDSPETTTDPQFSGKVHYQKPKACQDTTRSVIEFEFITGAGFDHSSLGPISRGLEAIANEYLMQEEWFVNQVSSAALKVESNTKTTTKPYNGGICPWSSCATYTTELTFSHSSGLSKGEIQYNVYRYVDAITRELTEKLNGDEIAYLGLKSASAGFAFTIRGVADGPMNSEQQRYLAGALVSFFQTSIAMTTPYVTAFDADFNDDSDTTRFLRVRRQLDGTTVVEGELYGGRSAPFDKEEFTVQARNSLKEDEDFLLQTLKYGSIIPQSDLPDESVLSYFDNIEGVSGTFTDEEPPDTDWGGKPFDHSTYTGDDIFGGALPDENGGGNNKDDPKLDGDKIQNVGQKAGGSPIFLIIAAVVGGLVVLAAAAYFAYSYYKKKKYKEDLELYRLKAKAERKVRRASKDGESEILTKDARKAIDEEKGAKTASSRSDSDSSPPESARPRLDSRDDDRGRSRTKRDTSSLPDAESMRRKARSKSSERVSSSKHTLLAAFMEEENTKKKPGDPRSGAKSLDGTDFRRSLPARALSDGPSSSKSGDVPDRNVSRSRSSDDLEVIRENLKRRNMTASPKSKGSDTKTSRSQHARSQNGDLAGMSSQPSSRSAHARSIGGDEEAGLYGSAAPRRGTRTPAQGQAPSAGQSRSNSPSRRAPARSQSYDPRASKAGIDSGRPGVRASRSGDLSSMRISRSGDSSMRQSRSGDLSAMRQSTARSAPVPNSEQIRRGRKRDGTSAANTETSSHSRDGGPRRTKSFDAGSPAERDTPRRTKSDGF